MRRHPQPTIPANPSVAPPRGFARSISARAAILAIATAVGCASGCDRPPPEPFIVAPVGMYPEGPYLAERTGALAFWGNGSLHTPVEVSPGRLVITVRARGHAVDGQAPRLRVTVGDREVGTIIVDSKFLKDYTVTAAVDEAGITTVRLAFDNYLARPKPLLSRHVVIERVSFQQTDALDFAPL